MKKYIYLSIMSLALSKPLMAMEGETSDAGHKLTIASPNLEHWDGQSAIDGWERVTTKRTPPANETWVPVRAYWLAESVHHEEYPFQFVFVTKAYKLKETKDRSHKITLARKGASKEQLTSGKVRFQGQDTNPLINPYIKEKKDGRKINGYRFELSKESLDNLPLNTFPEDATILISE
ncbi:MAG: hypothetical protein BGO67_09670 [Alphaproteobacteria bacterium 41-28]|nr:MAG: hypothetical protein BGO67_09670 [Alphaproteobacteria bacterium 41-28]